MAVILIPVWLLWNVRIAFAKKIAFVGLFSLSLVTMAIATARAADLAATTWDNGVIDPSYLWMWTAIEPCVGELPSDGHLIGHDFRLTHQQPLPSLVSQLSPNSSPLPSTPTSRSTSRLTHTCA